MKRHGVTLDVTQPPGTKGDFVFHMVFLDTGEIRQKRRSKEWLARRVFQHEIKTWEKRGEEIVFDSEEDER